jgi:hypothetical protein
LDENDDYQARIIGSFRQPQGNARFFFYSISNPLAAAGMSVPTVVPEQVVQVLADAPEKVLAGHGLGADPAAQNDPAAQGPGVAVPAGQLLPARQATQVEVYPCNFYLKPPALICA